MIKDKCLPVVLWGLGGYNGWLRIIFACDLLRAGGDAELIFYQPSLMQGAKATKGRKGFAFFVLLVTIATHLPIEVGAVGVLE